MPILTVTARGQVTFRKEVLQHLGITPGDKIALDLLPDGRGGASWRDNSQFCRPARGKNAEACHHRRNHRGGCARVGRQEMKVAVDTHVLVRAVVRDDPVQADAAALALTNAELIAVALPCLCEFV